MKRRSGARSFVRAGCALALGALGVTGAGWGSATPLSGSGLLRCVAPAEGAEYYAIELVSTRNVPGTARSTGRVALNPATSLFGVALSGDGSYHYRLEVDVDGLPDPGAGRSFVAWAATSRLDDVRRMGVLDAEGRIGGQVEWNKFLVFVTLESDADTGPNWEGPVVLRGISRSGLMHTMAGHGPFEDENCAAYGY